MGYKTESNKRSNKTNKLIDKDDNMVVARGEGGRGG